jgi:O-antigen/teichoic acid export membrane protein/glycosyltransferase involved in cell wall biosynthesis
MNHISRKINLALVSPNKNAYSETFISLHRTEIDANIHFLWQEALPEMSEEGPFMRYNFFGKVMRKLSRIFIPRLLNLHEKRIANYLKRHQIDVILAEFGFTGLAMAKLSRKTGIPLIVHFHGVDAYSKEILATYDYQPLFQTAEKVIVVSRHMYQQLVRLGCPEGKLVLNPYGPADIFFSVNNKYNSRDFLAIGRFVDKKAPQYTIRAFKQAVAHHPDAHLTMVGEGPLLDECKRLVRELDIEEKVGFAGVLQPDKIAGLVSESLAFVQHSRTAPNGDSEGTPVAVLEAGAGGLAVIATRHAGIPDVVLEESTGLLVEEGDIEGMSRAMIRMLDTPELAGQMGSAARRRIQENFTLKKHIDNLNKEIAEAADRRRGGSSGSNIIGAGDRNGSGHISDAGNGNGGGHISDAGSGNGGGHKHGKGKEHSFRRTLFSNILVAGSYTYLSQGITFLASTILARLLSPESYGIVGLITVFTGFIMVFSDGGLSYALIRSDFGRTFQRVLTNLSVFLGSILFLITVLAAWPIAHFYNNPGLIAPIIVLATTFIFRGLGLAQGAVLAKNLEFGYIGKVTLISNLAQILLSIPMAYLGAGYWALIIPQILAAIITAILYEKKVKLGMRLFPMNYTIVVFRHTRKLVGSVIGFASVNYWSRNSDNMIVGKWYGASELGIYNRAYSLLMLPLNLITGLFNNILFPNLKRLQSRNGDIEGEYYFVLNVISFLTFPLVLLFVSFPKEMVLLLWGKSWAQVADLLPYFGLLIFTQALLSTSGHLLILYKKEKAFMICGWITAVFLISFIIFGATISLEGIAQFYSLSYIVFVLLLNVFYIYIKTLGLNKKRVLTFWLPKVGLSLLLWCCLYFRLEYLQHLMIAVFGIYVLISGAPLLKAMAGRVGQTASGARILQSLGGFGASQAPRPKGRN